MVEIDDNAILVEPLKNHNDAELTRAYQALMLQLKRAGIISLKNVLDNKVSAAMKEVTHDEYKTQIEPIPSGCHRSNASEVVIRNVKARFLSVFAGGANNFPLHLRVRLLTQTEITINLVRQSSATPTVSAYAHLSGPFDYNTMPLTLMGSAVQIHKKTDKRGT